MTKGEYKPTKEEKLFEKYYEKLMRETTYARAHLKLWERLQDCTSSYLDELNQAPYFFRFTIKSHLDDALLTLSRVLDQHEESLSIWKFLNFAEQNREIFSTQALKQRMMRKPNYDEYWVESHSPIMLEQIQGHRQELERLEDTINRIKTWRDKALAHIDRQFHLRDKKVPIQRQQLQEVIDVLAQILNKYSVSYNSSSYSVQFVGADDIQGIMDSIRFQKEERKKQIEELRRQALDKR